MKSIFSKYFSTTYARDVVEINFSFALIKYLDDVDSSIYFHALWYFSIENNAKAVSISS
jgi:hypothetical protein